MTLKTNLEQTWKWLADGWRSISAGAANALTYFTPGKEHEPTGSDLRWGLLAADVSERDDHVLIELEAPGLDRADIDVTVNEHDVVVTGQKRYASDRKQGSYTISERAFGRFQRVIPLATTVTAEGAEAKYKRGVLKIRVPKAKSARSRRIEITSG